VRRVDTGNLSASFGPGYLLDAITLSITDEPVTNDLVDGALPWLGNFYNPIENAFSKTESHVARPEARRSERSMLYGTRSVL
tara:strand:- start:649 stop:894 length:246 start_codon:yes stop_codon:yes gene_type:complete